jgi:hypothetical protein
MVDGCCLSSVEEPLVLDKAPASIVDLGLGHSLLLELRGYRLLPLLVALGARSTRLGGIEWLEAPGAICAMLKLMPVEAII